MLLLSDEMLKMIPAHLRKSQVLLEIYNSETNKFEKVYSDIDDIENQRFIDTATWAIDIYEREYGIRKDRNKSIEERRQILKSRTRMSQNGKVGNELLSAVAGSFTIGDVNIQFDGKVNVELEAITNENVNFSGLIFAVNEIIPAHLGWNIVIRYDNKVALLTRSFSGVSDAYIYTNTFDSGEHWASGQMEKKSLTVETSYSVYEATFQDCGPAGALLYKTQQAISSVFKGLEKTFVYSGNFDCGEVNL